MLEVVIIGQKWLASSVLEAVAVLPGVNIVGVVPTGSSGRLALTAKRLNLPIYELAHCPNADIALAAHCCCYIDNAILSGFRSGVLAYHPSLLPRHRGRDAIRWAIYMREPVTGGSLYWMDEGVDTGPIYLQRFCHIRPDDTPEELWRRELAPLGVRLFVEAVQRLAEGEIPQYLPQEKCLATFEPAFTNRPPK